MPGVTVHHRNAVMTQRIADTIMSAVCDFGVRRFSNKDLKLTPKSFDFDFRDEGRFGKRSHDIIVRIPLHYFQERLEVGSDVLAEELGDFIRAALRGQNLCEGLTVGTSVPLCDIGWHADKV